jgi:hypothetical protein
VIHATVGVEVIYHDETVYLHTILYYKLTRVFSSCTPIPILALTLPPTGAIILRMGKSLRRGEEACIEKVLSRLGIPILYRLHGDATAEGM